MSPLLVTVCAVVLRLLICIFGWLYTFHIPYLGFFPYRDQIALFHRSPFISALASFDGIHYLLIAKNGYAEFTQAFFPLYPVLIRVVGTLFGRHFLLTSIGISWVCCAVGIYVWQKYIQLIYHDRRVTLWSTVFLICYPAAFFFSAVYTESLFFLIVVSTLFLLKKNKIYAVGICAALASLTRLAGVFLILPLGTYLWFYRRTLTFVQKLVLVLGPFIGVGIYCVYLWISTGDPLFFYHAQPAFGAHRSTHLILLPQVIYRYLRIFVTAAPNFQYTVSVWEFVVFHVVLVVLCVDLYLSYKHRKRETLPFELGLSVFSLINLLVPTFTGTFSSVPRYSLLSLAFFVALARRVPGTMPKIVIAIIFTILQIVVFAYFLQGYFVS